VLWGCPSVCVCVRADSLCGKLKSYLFVLHNSTEAFSDRLVVDYSVLSSGFIILGIPITVHDTMRDAILTCARRIAVLSQLNLPCTGNQKVEKRTRPNRPN